jgi:hypothetical protein
MSETQSIDYLVEKALSVLHNTEIKDKTQDNLQSINLYVTLNIHNGIIINTSVQNISTISENHNEIGHIILENSQETHISVSNEVGNIILENMTEVMNKLPDTNTEAGHIILENHTSLDTEVTNTILENITEVMNKLPDTNTEAGHIILENVTEVMNKLPDTNTEVGHIILENHTSLDTGVTNTILENHDSLDTGVTNTILENITEVMNKLPDTNIEVGHIILENHNPLDTGVTNTTPEINNEVELETSKFVLENLSPIPLSDKDILDEVSDKDIKEDWVEVLETKTSDVLEPVIDNEDYYFVLCPHCSCYIEVLKNSINCKIFRHGCYKTNTQLQIPPHSSKEVCDKLFADGLINGCGKPFKFDGKNVEICDYI